MEKVFSFSHFFGLLGEKLTRLKDSHGFFLNGKTLFFQFQLSFH